MRARTHISACLACILDVIVLTWSTTGTVKDADGQCLRRQPNVGAVGVGYIPDSPRSA
jgi:hypothetical protein